MSGGSLTVEFRPFYGPTRQIRVNSDQLNGGCVISTDCDGTRVEYVGHLYNLAAAPGSLEYVKPAYAHPACLAPEERWRRTHSRCQPNGTASIR